MNNIPGIYLEPLELHRLHNDLLMEYKIKHKYVDVECCNDFIIDNVKTTRGND